MKLGFRISKDVLLPLDAVTQTFAAIGRKGSGKTNLATVLAEQMLDGRAQVVVLDPVGNFWGLRLGPDGRSKGKNVYVLGGDHGDVPLTPEVGATVARIVVEKGVSVVLDVSGFRIGERKRFAAAFGEELLHLKKSRRTAMHLFLEEAQLFIPQRVMGDDARMVGAFEQIVRLGRNYGIGATLITQRPQSVNKEVLSQVECLCVLQVTGPHERKALEEWVQEAGGERKLVGELPGLERGEGYVWSPGWLRTYQRTRFNARTTFDSSATPESGKKRLVGKLSAMDVDDLKAGMADVIAEAERNDPTALRRRIAELERQLAKAPAAAPAGKERVVKVPVLEEATVGRLEKLVTQYTTLVAAAQTRLDKVTAALGAVDEGLRAARALPPPSTTPRAVYPGTGAARVQPLDVNMEAFMRPERGVVPARKLSGDAQGADGLRAGARLMLRVLAGVPYLTKTQLCVQAVMAQNSGTTGDYLSALRSRGLIMDHNGGLAATEAGQQLAATWGGPVKRGATEVVGAWWATGRFRAGARAMLEHLLLQGQGREVSRSQLCAAAGMAENSGTTGDYLSSLNAAGLIEKNGSMIRASSALYLFGA